MSKIKTAKSNLSLALSNSLMMSALVPLAMALTACQTSLPSDTQANLSSNSTVVPSGSLAISTPSATIPGGTSATISSTGGTAPYSYYITGASNSTINSSTGLFTAGLVAEVVQVLVQDSAGMTSVTSIQVTASVGATVNIYRSYYAANGDHLYSRDANEGPRAGYVNEGAKFSIYPTQLAGTTALYRCFSPSGQHMLSTSATCEGQGTQEGALGYVTGVASNAETVKLYRFVQVVNNVALRFATLDQNEGSSAGFTLEGPLGYVAPAVQGN